VRRPWLSGFIVGALAAFVLLVLPTAGLVLSVLLALLLQRARGLPAVAGMLCGIGFWGLALLAQANARCETSSSGCVSSNASAPVVIAAALIIAGAALSLALYVRTRGTRATA
jgi:chromate transport protein ChrA